VLSKRESARATAGRFDDHLMSGSSRRPNHVLEILFDVAAFQAELTCD